ncbi:MAG: ABC transporter ATP-binding protein [Pseudomonadota bacterium]
MAWEQSSSTESQPLLQVEGLSKNFGGLRAVDQASFRLGPGELKGLIGPNGAGKSTIFNLISGLHPPTEGRILFQGQNLAGQRPDRIVRAGIARTFQTVKLLESRTVLENMLTAFFMSAGYNLLDSILHTRRYHRREKEMKEKAMEYLGFFGVQQYRGLPGGELAYGLQRKVSLAMALCLSPRVLLLDEPMAGLTHSEKDDLMEAILRVKKTFGLSLILVEHDMKVIMRLCESIMVMNQGRLIAEGDAAAIRRNPEVVEAYLGASRT